MIRILLAVTLTALVVTPIHAQSLADAAKKAQEQRKASGTLANDGKSAKTVYTNDDISPVAPASSTPAASAAEDPWDETNQADREAKASIEDGCAIQWPSDTDKRKACEKEQFVALRKVQARARAGGGMNPACLTGPEVKRRGPSGATYTDWVAVNRCEESGK